MLDVLRQPKRDKAAAVKLLRRPMKKLGAAPSIIVTDKRCGVASKMIIGGGLSARASPDQTLIEAARRSFEWWPLLTKEDGWLIDRLAAHSEMDASNVTRYLPLAFLAPDIVEAVCFRHAAYRSECRTAEEFGGIPADWTQQNAF